MKKALVVLCLSVALIALPACTPPREYEANPAQLQTFDSIESLGGYFAENSAGSQQPGLLGLLLGGLFMPAYWPGSVLPYDPTLGSTSGLAGSDAQALWADEMDTARMQGDYLYTLDDYGLSVVKAVPADQMEVVGRFNMIDSSPASMRLLSDQKAVVLTSGSFGYYYYDASDPNYEEPWLDTYQSFFDVYVLDLKDPAHPAALARYSIQGGSLASRVVDGDKLAVLTANYPDQSYYTGIPVRRVPLEDILPQYRLIDADGQESVQPLLTYDQVLRPANPDGNAVLTVLTIDLANPGSAPAATGYLGYWDCAYQTPGSIYLTNTPYKPGGLFRTTTEVHRFDITGPTPRYAGSIKLDGRTDPFGSFQEKDGLLRLVTTKVGNLADLLTDYYYITNATYYALKPTDTGLEIVSKVDQIVDQISPYSLDLVGNYAIATGYKPNRDEPVSLVVDMADPMQPKQLGEGAWPGDWAYMRMLDATHMLALGAEWTTSDDSYYSGTFQLCMYDVTQALQPDLVHSLTVGEGYTDSTATWNSQQMYLANGLLILPIDLYEGSIPDDTGLQTFGGLYAYHLSAENGFELIGRVETADPYRSIYWHRPILKNGILYAVTNAGIRAVAMDDMATVLSSVRLPY